MSVRDIVEYLVLKALVGDVTVLNIIDDYFSLGLSPSEIARIYGISKYTVRTFIERVPVKGRYRYGSLGRRSGFTYPLLLAPSTPS